MGENGYGMLGRVQGSRYAHRISWEIHNGDIPKGLLVCHRCDVKNCVNPEHLFLGTHKQNTADMFAKGRHVARGAQKHPTLAASDD